MGFRSFITIAALIVSSLQQAQTTATNFVVNDCTGNNHDLFNVLNSGKVVVLVWVMPCATCINGALTAQTEVNSALVSNPGNVLFYIADDFGTTSCQTLNTWCSTNGITQATVFSNSKIKMSDYGSNGMPKVVVLGGQNHKVYYNENDPDISDLGIRSAVTQALAESVPTGFRGQLDNFATLKPNPVQQGASMLINSDKAQQAIVDLLDLNGRVVKQLFTGTLSPGENSLRIERTSVSSGLYFISVTTADGILRSRVVLE